LGPARDWDVFIEERLEPAIERGEVGDQAASFRARAKVERDAAYRGVRRALGSARYTAVMLDAMAWLVEPWDRMVKRGRRARLESPIADVAWRILRDADRALVDIGEPPDDDDAAGLHAVRIAAKKARYAAECLATLAPPAAVAAYVKALKRIQDSFGYSNDAGHAAVMIRRLVDPAAEGDLPRLIEAIAHPMGIEQTRGKMVAAWGAYGATMPIHRALGHGS
jgi:CHAD domain-containing protein